MEFLFEGVVEESAMGFLPVWRREISTFAFQPLPPHLPLRTLHRSSCLLHKFAQWGISLQPVILQENWLAGQPVTNWILQRTLP